MSPSETFLSLLSCPFRLRENSNLRPTTLWKLQLAGNKILSALPAQVLTDILLLDTYSQESGNQSVPRKPQLSPQFPPKRKA